SFVYAELMELNQVYINKIDQASSKKKLSRKKLTEEQALDKISNLSMQLQSEQEMLHYNLLTNKNKSIEEIDMSFIHCLTADNSTNVNQATDKCRQRIADIQYKMYEDYSRFLSHGSYVLSSGYIFEI
ncbi:hypothetical protein ACOYXX_13280, partial [Enterococcus thailandicus]